MGFKSRVRHKRHLLIPDTQLKPGVRTEHLHHAGLYIAQHRPDVIVVIGDWYDMHSLSSYSSRRALEGRRVRADIDAGNAGLRRFVGPWIGIPGYNPRLVYTLGNHEQRLERYLGDHPELDGYLGFDSFEFEHYGFEVYPFLKPVEIDGIQYCHFFPQGPNGAVMQNKRGQPNAQTQVRRVGQSSVAGHKQGLDYALQESLSGRKHGIIAGSFYAHTENYKTPMGNDHWRGMVMLNRVHKGDFDICPVSIDYLKERYG